jgi:tetratricopeptide (TPR) repeat protein
MPIRPVPRLRAGFAATALVLFATSARAQPHDHILAGYTRLYAGQPEEAHAHFEQIRKSHAQALAPWFGALFAQLARLNHDESLAAPFERELDAFIDAAAARHVRSRTDAEALFYLAQAYLLRSTYRLNHDKGTWGAARDAAKSKALSDEYLKRHPEHGDAYMALGLYNYYVDIAPNFVKVLRILLFLPSGSRAEGLKQLERASTQGSMFAPFAQRALAEIYGSFEGRLADAIPLAEKYVQRFPRNNEMRLELASMYLHQTVEDYTGAASQYHAVIGSSRETTPRQLSEKYRALLGLANVRRTEWRIDEAITLLTQAINEQPSKPAWVMPNLLLRRANYRMLLNDTEAEADARQVLGAPAMTEWHKSAQQLITQHEQRRKSGEGVVYAALIPGNRLVAERKFEDARRVYDRVGTKHPGDWQVRFRLAYLDFARRDYASAAGQFQQIASTPARIAPWIKAGAMLHLAWTHDLAGRRAEAVKLYRQIVDEYETEAAAAAARLGLIAPYRGRIRATS